jgi:hypothetical protein
MLGILKKVEVCCKKISPECEAMIKTITYDPTNMATFPFIFFNPITYTYI